MGWEKVLIVEDEENERSGLAELISAWGYRTEIAADGVEGLEKIESWEPGIVVTDLKMCFPDAMRALADPADRAGINRRGGFGHEARRL